MNKLLEVNRDIRDIKDPTLSKISIINSLTYQEPENTLSES